MDYLQNHIWCRDSNWGGEYSCRHLVHFNKYEDHNANDWDALIDDQSEVYMSQSRYETSKEVHGDRLSEDFHVQMATRKTNNLKPHVIGWLHAYVQDRPKHDKEESPKGWCIPSKESRAGESMSMTVFFHRKRDAMAFIRRFSEHRKPVHYCQYFSDVRKTLDLDTGKYKVD